MMIQGLYPILPFVLGIFAFAFLALGIILRHHWQMYFPDQAFTRRLQIIYWGVGGILLAIMAVAYFTSLT